jgi:hypothetical protein
MSTTNHIWSALGLNTALHSDKPGINCLKYGKANSFSKNTMERMLKTRDD